MGHKKIATSDKTRKIVWNEFDKLEDDAFVDDVVIVSHYHRSMQEKTRGNGRGVTCCRDVCAPQTNEK